VEISFVDRLISEGPLSVLRHLYYYTTQYGLSVKQFTGAHQNYWRELPARLQKAKDNPKSLKAIINELENLAEGYEERLRKRRAQIRGKWQEKEVVLNAQLLSVLAALPRRLLAIMFKNLTEAKNNPQEYRVVNLYIEGEKGEDTDFVEPDLLLLGEGQLLMVEVKTRGGPTSSRSYPPKQLLNYLRLIVECRDSNNKELPVRFLHLILVPTTELRWMENSKKWVKGYDVDKGLLSIDLDACLKLCKKVPKSVSERIQSLLAETPIYYRSWKQLAEAFGFAVKEFNDERNQAHWERIGNELNALTRKAEKYA